MRRYLGWLTEGPPVRGAALFAALYLGTALPRLGHPGEYVFDEVYQAFTAGRYAAGDAAAYLWSTKAQGPTKTCAYEWIHPPVAKLVLAVSIAALGDRPIGWRLPCALTGAAMVALTYLLGRRLLRVRGAAEIAALSLAADGLVIVLGRTGMSDIFVAVFVLAAYLQFHGWLTGRWPEAPAPRSDRDGAASRRRLWLAGALCGLGIATKWFALLAWGWMGIVVGVDAAVSAVRGLARGRGIGALEPLAHVAGAFVICPAAIYLLCYLPFFAVGHGLGDFRELIRQQLWYHAHLTAKHDYASAFWGWPLLARSVWLWTGTQGAVHRDVYLLGNPVLWWTSVVALGAVALRFLRALASRVRPAHAATVLVMGWFGQWLPWALPARPAFLYYMLTALPFAALAVGRLLAGAASRWRRAGVALVAAYLVALCAAAIWLYPLWTGLPLPEESWRARFLVPGWR